jgi:hypothetical protein
MTFIPLTPSVGKEKRILEGVKKSQSWIGLRECAERSTPPPGDWTLVDERPYHDPGLLRP